MISHAPRDIPAADFENTTSRDELRGLVFLFGTVATLTAICGLIVWIVMMTH